MTVVSISDDHYLPYANSFQAFEKLWKSKGMPTAAILDYAQALTAAYARDHPTNNLTPKLPIRLITQVRKGKELRESGMIRRVNAVFDVLSEEVRIGAIAEHLEDGISDLQIPYDAGQITGAAAIVRLGQIFSNYSRPELNGKRAVDRAVKQASALTDKIITNHPHLLPYYPEHEIHRLVKDPVVALTRQLATLFNDRVGGSNFWARTDGYVYLPQVQALITSKNGVMYRVEHDPIAELEAQPA